MLEFFTEDNVNLCIKLCMKEDAGWGGSANFSGKSSDSVVSVVSRVHQALNTTYLACLKVLMWFVFAIYGLFIFMVNWKEVYSEPCKTSEVELFAKS